MTKELLSEDGVEYVLSEKFTQDPIEEYFSKQRRAGGASDNPTTKQVADNMVVFQAADTAVRSSRYGNVSRKREQGDDGNVLPMPKRKKR